MIMATFAEIEAAKIIGKAIQEHGQAMIEALELIDDSIQKGFSDLEEQLENIGDAIRDLEPEETEGSN